MDAKSRSASNENSPPNKHAKTSPHPGHRIIEYNGERLRRKEKDRFEKVSLRLGSMQLTASWMRSKMRGTCVGNKKAT